MGHVLIIDDDRMFCETMAQLVEKMGHEVVKAFSIGQGLEEAGGNRFDAVLLDVGLPDGSGLDLLPKLKANPADPEVIILTGAGDPEGAELAIETGAWDYIEKTASTKKMMLPLIRALQYRQDRMAMKPPATLKREGIIGESFAIRLCLDLVAQAAGSDANVLVTGETGTGKELVARAIHKNSARSQERFVVVDCAALPATLVESVLFGHAKGAFTGADRTQAGLIKQADGGTLFLDELGEMPLSVQKAFLRVLQERRFRPVGSKVEVKSEFRLIAATHQDLDAMVQAGNFRQDLLYRIRALGIHLPPLRERARDVRELAVHYTAKLFENHRAGTKGVSAEFFDKLESYPWPGNVRELVHTLEYAIAAAEHDPTLLPIHLPSRIRVYSARALVEKPRWNKIPSRGDVGAFNEVSSFREVMAATERKYFHNLIEHTRGDIKEACRVSGLSRSRLYALLKKHDISRRY